MRMKVLIVHNTYQQPGGEDAVVFNESTLLKNVGCNTRLYSVSNSAISGPKEKIDAFVNTVYSKKSKNELSREIEKFQPDIVHVHNFFPLLTPSIYDACLEANVPVVQTLHNYRPICPGALLMRDGKVCEKCITNSSPLWGVFHRCYRNSFIGSLAVARMVDFHAKRKTWVTKVASFIALTEFSRKKFIAGGFPHDRIVVKPNFVPDGGSANSCQRTGALFVGRLSSEKGIEILIGAWKNIDITLKVVGEGPLMDHLKFIAPSNVQFLGHITSQKVKVEMNKALFMVLPSICYENFPVTVAEAYACGLPVIASRLGAMEEIVVDGVTGLHFTSGDSGDLETKVLWALGHRKELLSMGENTRLEYEKKYTAYENSKKLLEIYQKTLIEFKRNHDCGIESGKISN
jgi:glycosyltransferase involved in cell wall biosynthesis